MAGSRSQEEISEYLKKQREEILGPENQWFAGQAVGHPPTPQESGLHYVKHGGAEDFASRWQREHS